MPIRVIRFTDNLLTESVEIHEIEGVSVKVYGVAKTVADCFRHRIKLVLLLPLKASRKRCGSARQRPPRLPARQSVAAFLP